MARRKRAYLDEGYSSDSASSSASVEEPRRRLGKGKEDAVYGIFGDEGENERKGGIGRTVHGEDRKGRKIDYLRGQAFVTATGNDTASSSKSQSVEMVDVEREDGMDLSTEIDDEESESDEDSSVSDTDFYARQPATEEEEMETRNAFSTVPTIENQQAQKHQSSMEGFEPTSFVSTRGGIGSARLGIGAQHSDPGLADSIPMSSKAGIGSKGGIGSNGLATSRPGIGSLRSFLPAQEMSDSATKNEHEDRDPSQAIMPTDAFSKFASQSLQNARPLIAPTTTPKISFKTGGGKFDPAKYLAQMGWSGGGLGKQGEGIVNPIEVKQRPERAGIAFGGLKEKTKQAKEEARRRGEEVSSDEEDRRSREKKGAKHKSARGNERKEVEQLWTKSERKPRKPKIEHRTYEQILAEHAQHGMTINDPASQQKIIDASGNEYSSISAALAKHSVPTNDCSQLIEIRHNLRLICDGNLKALDVLANEGSAIQDRRKWLERDLHESERRKHDLVLKLERLQTIVKIAQDLEALGKRAQEDSTVRLEDFKQLVGTISQLDESAVAEMELDASLVASITPIFRRELSTWSLLDDPTRLCRSMKDLSSALRIDAREEKMTPYASLLWNVWLPPVRSSLNNEWNLQDTKSVTEFYESWSPLLPAFIRDNVSQQLIIPKLRSAVSDWDGKSALYKVVFPWMSLLDRQMDDVVSESKRRIRSSLKSWKVSNGVPSELRKWKDVLRTNEWNAMLLDQVVDKLSTYLKENLFIESNASAQDKQPLKDVLEWRSLMPSKMLSKLLLARLIPKWLERLHDKLKDPQGDTAEVADWYSKWKKYFEQKGIDSLEGVQTGLQAALKMMDEALRTDRRNLKMPNLKEIQERNQFSSKKSDSRSQVQSQNNIATTFRQIVEESAANADLIVQSLNRTEIKSGMPLFRISRSIDGKGGLNFYLEDDVIFLERKSSISSETKSQYDPVSIEELIKRCK